MPEDFDESRLKGILDNEIAIAENYIRSELTPYRERAINYYNGNITDVPVVEGRSKYVSRDVSNVVGWVLPDVMRVFTASDRIVDCLPETRADEATCDQAADYLNYCFWRDNPGYQIMWDATWDALVNKDGIVKQFWDVREEVKYHNYTGLTEEEIAVFLAEDNSDEVAEDSSHYIKVEIVEKSKPYYQDVPTEVEVPVAPEPMTPAPMVDMRSAGMEAPEMPAQESMESQEAPEPPMQTVTVMQLTELFDVRIRRTTKMGRMVYQTVAPENFGTDPNALDLHTNWRFQFEKSIDLTRSDLIKMGFERERVDAIPAYAARLTSPEDLARRNLITRQYDTPEHSMERINLYECYVKVDINDDGVAEVVRVMYAGHAGGSNILDWEEWDDETPYDKIPCTPVPHRLASDSLADEVVDLAKFKTVLGRQLFDNLYQVNMPMPIVEKDSILNMEALINRQIGVPILKKASTAPVQWDVTPFVGDKILAAMDHLDGVIEMRTGVSRASASLDPEALQNQTATAAQINRDASHSQVELIARNQAELGWKRVFQKSLKIVVKNQDRARTIRLRDKWVDMDPRQWNIGMDIVINVGLGTGSRDRDMAMLNNIMMTQQTDLQQLQAAGFVDEALDMVPKIIKTQIKMAEAAGVKSPETYYPEITPERLDEMKDTAKAAAGQDDPKLRAEKEKAAAEMAMKSQQMQADAEIKTQQMQIDAGLKSKQLAAEIQLKREQMTAEFALKREQMAEELRLKREYGFADAFNQTARTLGGGNVHLGGDPG